MNLMPIAHKQEKNKNKYNNEFQQDFTIVVRE